MSKELPILFSTPMVKTEKTEYEVGKKYLVDVAICKDVTGKEIVVPILPLLHKDPAFGVDHLHYHIDCRFKMTKEVMRRFMVKDFTTIRPVWLTNPHQEVELIRIEKKQLLCVNLTTGFDMDWMTNKRNAGRTQKYFDWYKTMIGQSCAGKKCPHYGTEMIDNGNHLVCPMHNIIGSKKTNKIINIPK